MQTIKELPTDLSYHPSVELKITGEPKMVLDISKSTAKMIPENLKGVDCVIAGKGQLLHVAPDFLGEIVTIDLIEPKQGEKKYSRTAMSEGEKQFLVRSYMAQERLHPGVFDSSSKKSSVSDFETNLPKNLSFSWNFKTDSGVLDATKTTLTRRPNIAYVNKVLLPGDDAVSSLLMGSREI